MKPPTIERTSAAKAGWVIVVVLLGWVAFFLFPFPRAKPEPKVKIEPPPVSALVQAGLRDYRDWDGLPQIFALWAERAEWRDDRTFFAFWHPVAKDYSYHFEARRVGGTYRFREVPPPAPAAYTLGEILADDCPIRFYHATVAAPAVGSSSAFDGRAGMPSNLERETIPPAVVELPVAGPALTPAEPKR